MGFMSTRTYLAIGLGVAFFFYLIAAVFGTDLIRSIADIKFRAQLAGLGVLAVVIADPFLWALANPLFGAIAFGLLWPFVAIWLFLLFVMLLIALGSNTARDLQDQF